MQIARQGAHRDDSGEGLREIQKEKAEASGILGLTLPSQGVLILFYFILSYVIFIIFFQRGRKEGEGEERQ